MLFNHGLTVQELYTNSPKDLTDKNKRWFLLRYGSADSFEDAISDPFKYSLVLILNYILDKRIRFKIPRVEDSYIDFEIVKDEKFKEHKNLGRFKEIDFIASDFTGYAVRYYYQGKVYQRSVQIYFGGDLKKKFLNYVNSGIPFYTKSTVEIDYFFPYIHDQFNELSYSEVKKLVLHGFRRMHSAIKTGCAVSVAIYKYQPNCIFHIGKLTGDPEEQIKIFDRKRARKLRKISAWKREEYDGYYYIGLNSERMEEWVENNKTSRVIVKFNNIVARKLKEEFYYKAKNLYLFKFKVPKFKGWFFWKEQIKIRDLEFVGKVVDYKLLPSTKTWKEVIKEYEKRDNIDI